VLAFKASIGPVQRRAFRRQAVANARVREALSPEISLQVFHEGRRFQLPAPKPRGMWLESRLARLPRMFCDAI
jgi:hypothetical protein